MTAQKLKVLLVEDDQIDRMAFLRHVEKTGLPYQCSVVGSVAEARAIPASEKFDVVLLDHNLNDGTGFDLVPQFPETPAIFLTGSESPEVAVRAMKCGAADYLLKDHDRNYLKLLPVSVERALKQRVDREKLAESEELFRQSFSEAPIGKAFIASGGKLLRVNKALCRFFGYMEEELLAGGFKLIMPLPDQPDCMEQFFPPRTGIVQTHRAEIAGQRKDGSDIWIQVDLAQVPDRRGETVTYSAQIQDITVRKQAEAEIKRAKDYAENIINTAPTLICGLTEDGTVEFINPAATKILGYTAEELVGKNWWQLFYPGDSYRQAQRLIVQCRAGQLVNQETTLTAKDGSAKTISWSSTKLTGPDGEIQEIVGIGMDITAQRQSEEVRGKLEAQLHHSQKMEALGSLAGGVAHEFNNMLGAIIGYTELSKMELGPTHNVSMKLDQVLKASQRAKDIVQQILTFSRRQELKREFINLSNIVQESMRAIRTTIPHNVELVAEVPADCPPVYGNATQIHQSLANLCTNAWHAMEKTGGTIVVSQKIIQLMHDAKNARLGLPEGYYSVLSVADNGQGMDQTTLDRVFEPFFTTKGPGRGSGLGMAVVHGIMKSHDGAVAVQSELGKGTTVSLYFPVRAIQHASAQEPEKAPLPKGKGQWILLVDDEAPLASIGTKVLQHLNYQVKAFTSAQEAVQFFSRDPAAFDLIITDLTMPGMTGIDLADAILEIRKDIPILLATGYIEESVREQAALLGFKEILIKPLTAQIMAEGVNRIFTGKK